MDIADAVVCFYSPATHNSTAARSVDVCVAKRQADKSRHYTDWCKHCYSRHSLHNTVLQRSLLLLQYCSTIPRSCEATQ